MKRVLLALAVLGVALVASEAQAQFITRGPGGSLGISSGNGTYMFIYPERLDPLANIPQPGTYQSTPFGPIWVGYDGMVHGTLIDPSTGDIHARAPGRPGPRTAPPPRVAPPRRYPVPYRSVR